MIMLSYFYDFNGPAACDHCSPRHVSASVRRVHAWVSCACCDAPSAVSCGRCMRCIWFVLGLFSHVLTAPRPGSASVGSGASAFVPLSAGGSRMTGRVAAACGRAGAAHEPPPWARSFIVGGRAPRRRCQELAGLICGPSRLHMGVGSENLKTVVVVGGGPAGFMAAIQAARAAEDVGSRIHVIVLEATSKVLGKVKISGGGRCNVLHDETKGARVISDGYPRGRRELLGALSRFGPTETANWFRSEGVTLKTEADGRMFPITDSSQTIIDALEGAASRAGVEVRTLTRVDELALAHGFSAEDPPGMSDKRKFQADHNSLPIFFYLSCPDACHRRFPGTSPHLTWC